MSKELIYTSAPRGLLPGSSGFCTVAMSEGLPNSWRERLESLSAYTRTYPPDDPRNPVVFSHLRVNSLHVLSRIQEMGEEYTGRTNHLAHHVVLDDRELPLGGPAWLLSQPGFLIEAWSGTARWLEPARVVPNGDSLPRVCRTWQKLTGDAGWAGVLAETFLESPERPALLLYEAGQKVLSLFVEAMALLPPERRWDTTFSTYFTGLLPGLTCSWRGVLRGTGDARELSRRPDVLVIDLAAHAALTQDGPLIELARTGRSLNAPTPKKHVAVRGGHLQPAAVADSASWGRRERPAPSDTLDSIPPMPPIPISHRAADSVGWRVPPLALVLLILLATTAGGGVMWLVLRSKAPSGIEDPAGAKTQITTIDWEKESKKLKAELADIDEKLRVSEKERKSLLQTIEDQKPKVAAYDAMMRTFEAGSRLLRHWLPDKTNGDAIRPDKHKGMLRGEGKETPRGQR